MFCHGKKCFDEHPWTYFFVHNKDFLCMKLRDRRFACFQGFADNHLIAGGKGCTHLHSYHQWWFRYSFPALFPTADITSHLKNLCQPNGWKIIILIVLILFLLLGSGIFLRVVDTCVFFKICILTLCSFFPLLIFFLFILFMNVIDINILCIYIFFSNTL